MSTQHTPGRKKAPIPVAWIKVYGPAGDYRGSLVSTDDAAVLCAVLGHGSEARNGHRKVNAIWREGFEAVSAAESYDAAAAFMNERTSPTWPDATAKATEGATA